MVYIFTIIFSITVAIFDKTTKKIPNWLILIGMVSGLVFNILIKPISIKEWVIRGIFLIIIFLFGMRRLIGGGDIKLWMTLNILIGAVYSSLSLAIGSVIIIIVALFTDFKGNAPTVFLSLNNIAITKRINTVIATSKGYPLGFYVMIPVILFCLLELFGVGIYG